METIIATTSLLMLGILAGVYIHRKYHSNYSSRKIVIKADNSKNFLFLQSKVRFLEMNHQIGGLTIDTTKRKVEFYSTDSIEDYGGSGFVQFGPLASKKDPVYHPHSTTW